MARIGTIEHFEQLHHKWHGDGTYAYPLKRLGIGGYRVFAFGYWWLTSKRPTKAHEHRVYQGGPR